MFIIAKKKKKKGLGHTAQNSCKITVRARKVKNDVPKMLRVPFSVWWNLHDFYSGCTFL